MHMNKPRDNSFELSLVIGDLLIIIIDKIIYKTQE